MKNNYSILATVDVTSYTSLKDLYEDLLAVKRDVFADDERIVIVFNSSNQKKLIDQLLIDIDIDDFFIIFKTTDNCNGLDFNFGDSFCIYPWSNIEIKNTGVFSPCCKFQVGILDDQEQPMTIQNASIDTAYHSKFMKNLRNAFRKNIKPHACNDCWINEDSGVGISLRQRAEYKFRDVYYTLDYVNDTINNLRSMDLKLGSTCNLSCRICSPYPSSKIATMELNAGRLSKIEFNQIKENTRWSELDNFWYQFLPIVHNLRELDILGGEPLLVKSHYNFLKKLVELDVAKNIRLDYTSNGTIFAEEYIPIWKEFQEVKISFSIDDINDRFEYQRNNAVWDKVVDNIKRYSLLKSDKFITEMYPTINIQNVYYLPELVDWATSMEFNHIEYSYLHGPEYLSIESMPDQAKTLVLHKLRPYVDKHPMILSSVTMIEHSANGVSNLEFLKQMQMRDTERNQNFASAHTDIAKAMGYE